MFRATCIALVVTALGVGRPAAAEPIAPGSEAYEGTAKNIILFLGDGMGVSTITAARILAGGAEAELTLDRFPFTALSRTYSTSHQVTDSAAGMNAPMTGHKTPNRTIAMDAEGNRLRTFLELAERAGKSTGIVTTTTVTHATPASCYAHIDSRDKQAAIAAQLVPGTATFNRDLGDGLEVILGGGRKFFVGDATGGDLRTQMERAGYTYVTTGTGLSALDWGTTGKLLGLFADSHMRFAMQNAAAPADEPSLADMTTAALRILQQNDAGFFLMVEGGRIDHGHHANSAHIALTEMLEFDRAIGTAIAMVELRETLIIVTADHSHVMTIAGYPKRGTSIFGIAGEDAAGVPYTTLSYANGPGYRGQTPRLGPAADGFHDIQGGPAPGDSTAPTYVNEATAPLPSETHAGEDVIIWGLGCRAGQVRGVVENTRIFEWMRAASGL